MPQPFEAVVRRVLAIDERDARIRSCIEKSWETLKTQYVDRPRWRRKSTARHLMWENCVDSVMSEFDSDRGISPVGHYDTFSFIADDTVFFRLKKATSSLFSANYPTPLAGLFHVHREDLFGHEGHHRVEIVHVFNRFQTALEWIGVVARDRRRVLWQFELPTRGTGVIPLPTKVPAPSGTAAAKVLSPASLPNEKKNDDEKK